MLTKIFMLDNQDLEFFREEVVGKRTWKWISGSSSESVETTWSHLNSLLSSDLLDFPRIRLCNEKNSMTRGFRGFMQYGISDTGDVIPSLKRGVLVNLLSEGGTLIIDRCNQFFPDISALARSFADFFGCVVSANLYASFSATSGFGLHFDDHDVIALQLEGEKKWSIYKPTHVDPLPHEKSFYFQKPTGAPDEVVTLRKGELLYIPRGYWHNVVSSKNNSLHVSFAINRTRRIDVVRQMVAALQDDEFFRASATFDSDKEDFGEFRKRVLELFANEDISKWYDITRHGQLEQFQKKVFNFPSLT